MERSTLPGMGRREWLAGAVPACAALCLRPCEILGCDPSELAGLPQEGANPFDQELKAPMTYRALMRRRWGGDYIPIMRALAEKIGTEELLEMIRDITYEKNRRQGERAAERAPNTELRTLMGAFRNPNPNGVFANSNVWEIVEDTESAFEIRITGCLAAEVFLENGAAELGFATVCHADHGLAAGFNPRIKLERDKTLMEGDDCCNHRWVVL